MRDRSIERDYDINYACRASHQSMDDLEEYVKLLLDVGHDPTPLLRVLNEQWITILQRYAAISF